MRELDVAVRAAREAGGIALEHRARGVDAGYKDGRDVVTAADHACQDRIIAVIGDAFPGDAVVAEEGDPPPEGEVVGTRRWYVDPIDGTSNYLKGRYWWGVSVAFCDAGDRLTAGAVYLPSLDEMYAAVDGAGATCNERPVRCSSVGSLRESLVSSGFPGADALIETSERNVAAWRRVMRQALSVRATGAVAPDWCAVASGRAEGSWTLHVGRWDIAAGIVIAREAGALVTDFDGVPLHGPSEAGVAAVPGIHADLLKLIRA